jgi:hypothetical protein
MNKLVIPEYVFRIECEKCPKVDKVTRKGIRPGRVVNIGCNGCTEYISIKIPAGTTSTHIARNTKTPPLTVIVYRNN